MSIKGMGGILLVAAIVGLSVSMGVLQLAPIQFVYAHVTVKDKDSGSTISGVLVQFDLSKGLTEFYGDVDYSATTTSSGVASKQVQEGNYKLNLIKEGYTKIEALGPYTFNQYQNYLTVYMERDTTPSTGHKATFYLRDLGNNPVKFADVTFDGNPYSPTGDGVVVLINVPTGVHSIRFKSVVATPINFDFTTTFTMPDRDAIFTVWVETGVIEDGSPPVKPFNPSNFLTLTNVILIGAGFLGIMILFQGRGPELYRILGGRSRAINAPEMVS